MAMRSLLLSLVALAALSVPALADGPIYAPLALYPNNDSTSGNQTASFSAIRNRVQNSDDLSTWTLTGLSYSGAVATPDGGTANGGFGTGSGATEAIQSANTSWLSGASTWMGAVYVVGNAGYPYDYVTLTNAAGTESVTAWFNTATCSTLSNATSGGAAFYGSWTVSEAVNGWCRLLINGRINGSSSQANIAVGISSADGSTTWSGGSGQSFEAWGADLYITSVAGNGNSPFQPHVPTGASVAVGPGTFSLGATVTNRVHYVQFAQPTVSCAGGSGTPTITSPSADALGSFTTATSNTACTVTFAGKPASWTATPLCWAAAASSGVTAYEDASSSTSAATFDFSAALTGVLVRYGCEEAVQ